jgi:parallel beta-helix repeat protein
MTIPKKKKKIVSMATVKKVDIKPAVALLLAGLAILASLLAINSINKSKSVKVRMAAASVTYFVDCGAAVNGNGTQTSPFNNLSSTHWLPLNPGDKVLLKRGTTCNQQKLYIHNSGVSGSPITFGVYPEVSSDPKPIIDGQNGTTIDFGVQVSGASYVTIKDLVIRNIANANFNNTASAVAVENSSNITLDGLEVQNSYGMGGITVVFDNGQGNNKIQNCKVSGTQGTVSQPYQAGGGAGIKVIPYGSTLVGNSRYASNNLADNNEIANNEQAGLTFLNINNSTISNNKIYGNGGAGIHLGGNSSGNKIEYNKVYQNTKKIDDLFGIDLLQVGNNNIVRYNEVHDQYYDLTGGSTIANPGNSPDITKYGSGGIRFDGGIPNADTWKSTGNQAYYNLVYNEQKGLAVLNFNNVAFYNNTVYNSAHSGIQALAYNDAFKNFGGLVVKNNIISVSPRMVHYSARYGGTWDGALPVFNNNLYYSTDGNPKFVWTYNEAGVSAEPFYTYTFNQWKNGDAATTDSAWTQYSGRVWYVARAKNPAAVYAAGERWSRIIEGDLVAAITSPTCSKSWILNEAGADNWLLALCWTSVSRPTGVTVYNTEIAAGSEVNSLTADPKFVSAAVDNFDLQSTSPAINAGAGVGLTLGYDRRTVPYGVAPDIGAYEYGSQPKCTPNCAGKTCGSDGCGGSCGPDTKSCTATFGSCTATGTQTCSNGNYGACQAVDPRVVYYKDADRDYWGNPNSSTASCQTPSSYTKNNVTIQYVTISNIRYVNNKYDCNDSRASTGTSPCASCSSSTCYIIR